MKYQYNKNAKFSKNVTVFLLTNRGSIVKEKKTFHKGNNSLFQDMHDRKQIMTDKLLLISHFRQDWEPENSSK